MFQSLLPHSHFPPILPILLQMNSVHASSLFDILKIHFNIIQRPLGSTTTKQSTGNLSIQTTSEHSLYLRESKIVSTI